MQPDLLVLDEPTSGLDPLMEIAFRELVGTARANGQTVFLSSHILSEVEAVCDRVAILRKGRLVEVGTLDDLRKLNTQDVDIAFAGTPPDLQDLRTMAGVAEVVADGNRVTLRFKGAANDLIRALAQHDVADLDIREPSLEEVFLTFYGEHEPSSTD